MPRQYISQLLVLNAELLTTLFRYNKIQPSQVLTIMRAEIKMTQSKMSDAFNTIS